MATLLDLPNETLLEVIDATRPDSIWSLIRCCKRIWFLGAKDLEQHRRDVGRYRKPNLYLWNGKYFSTYHFFFEFLLQPRRALYVNSVDIFSRWSKDIRSGTIILASKTWKMLDETCRLFFRAPGCPYIQGNEVSEWVKRLRRGDMTTTLCLMLTLLPNLKTLTINNHNGQGYSELIYKVSKANNSSPCRTSGALPLNKLDTIFINDTQSMTQIDERPGIYEACMTLPSLRKLKGACIDCSFNRWPSEGEFPYVSNVTEVEFQRSAINAEAFTRLLKRTSNLQRFTYGFSQLIGISGDYTATSLKSVLEQYAARTLTHLSLSFDPCALKNEFGHLIGSLRQLQVLQHLCINADMFIERRNCLHPLIDLLPLLPASIKTLGLRSTKTLGVRYTLGELRSRREEYLPNLRKILHEKTVPISKEMIDDCASVGIDLGTI